MNFDLALFNLIHDLAGKSRLLDFLGIFLADYFGYLLILAAIALVAMESDWRKKFNYYTTLALSLILSRGIFTETIRFIYARPRPFTALEFAPLIAEKDYGAFPSGHAAFYFALAGVIWLLNKKWGWRFAAAAALMGLARVFAGVHWPLDIVGGAIVGLGSVWLIDKYLISSKTAYSQN